MADVETNMSEATPLVGTGNVGDPVPNGGLLHQQSGSQKVSETPDGQNQNGETKSGQSNLNFSKMSRRKKTVLILCTFEMFLCGCAFSLLGPFFSLEAEKKGMSITLIGFVFGVFELVIFIFSPIFGNYLTTIGPKFCYVAGIGVGGVCAILFGTLDKCPNGLPFIVICIVCRSVEGIGFSSFINACLAIISSEFPGNVGFTLGLLETGHGLGFAVGPAIGGILYEYGGYGLPFYFIGVLILLNGILTSRFLPPPGNIAKKRKGSIFDLCRSPMVVIPMLSVLFGVMGIATFDATFARHLESFQLSGSMVGLFYTIVAMIYSIMSPFWGYLTDKKDIQSPLIIFGNFALGMSFLIMGPSPMFPFIPFELWTVAIGMTFLGLSFGCTLVPTIKCMMKGACELDYEGNIDTYAMVSGLFKSVYCFGGFLGPTAMSFLIDEFDSRVAYTVVGGGNVAVMVVCVVFFLNRYIRRRKNMKLSYQYIENCSDKIEDKEKEFLRSATIFTKSFSPPDTAC